MGCLVWIVGPGVKTESDRACPIPVRLRARLEGSSFAIVVRWVTHVFVFAPNPLDPRARCAAMDRRSSFALLLLLACSGSDAPAAPPPSAPPIPTVPTLPPSPSPTPTAPSATPVPPAPPAPPTPTSAWLERPNLASFAQGAVLMRSDPEGAWNVLDEFVGSSWERSDAQANPTATAVIELAARARVEGVRLTLDDYWTVRMPNEIVIELGDAASGPFREIAKHTLPAELPETGDAPYVVDVPTGGQAGGGSEGRYVQVRLVGRRGGAEEALGPFLSDVAVHGAFVAPVAPETRAVGSWNGGWLLGTFEIVEENGRMRACFSRDGANASVVVDGRSIQLRWKAEDGGDAMALLVRGPDGHLHGTAQHWSAEGQGGEPASIDVDPLERAEPICTRTPEPSAIERELESARRARVYGILFDFAQHVPRAESNGVLDELAQVLARHEDWSIAIEGHTDAVGDDASNLALSERRAAAVREALASRGVATERTTSVGHGESQPVAPNETAVGRARNRRVEIVLR